MKRKRKNPALRYIESQPQFPFIEIQEPQCEKCLGHKVIKKEIVESQAKGEKQNSKILTTHLEVSEHSLIFWSRPIQPFPFVFMLQVSEANPVAVSPHHLFFYPLLNNKPETVR